jgi:hypothetical protein
MSNYFSHIFAGVLGAAGAAAIMYWTQTKSLTISCVTTQNFEDTDKISQLRPPERKTADQLQKICRSRKSSIPCQNAKLLKGILARIFTFTLGKKRGNSDNQFVQTTSPIFYKI